MLIALRQYTKEEANYSRQSAGNYQLLEPALSDGHAKLAKALLENGASMETVCTNGRRPLHWAVHQGHVAIVSTLLEKGATKEAVD